MFSFLQNELVTLQLTSIIILVAKPTKLVTFAIALVASLRIPNDIWFCHTERAAYERSQPDQTNGERELLNHYSINYFEGNHSLLYIDHF